MVFANIAVKSRYDKSYKSLRLHVGILVFLYLYNRYKILGVYYKYSNQRISPFKILKKVGKLVYYLKLSLNIYIYPIISIIQLKPALNPANNLYYHLPPPPSLVEEKDTNLVNPLYKIKKFLDKELGKDRYLIKWKGYGNKYNV